mmetsp:Transcript_17739/g.50507  ORF Transcript_17739/g.50507 Transcript_17739/m.50507 type:complete len:413 (-) Transcript_17739:812-2050(-)
MISLVAPATGSATPPQASALQPPSHLRLEACSQLQAAAIVQQPLLQPSRSRQQEAKEEGPWLGRAARELGVELAGQEEGVALQLAELHALAAIVLAGKVQALPLHGRHAGSRDLVAVPVALVYHGPPAVEPAGQGIGIPDDRRARAQAHGASHHRSRGLWQEDDDRVGRLLIKLCRIGCVPPELAAGKLDHSRLQPHANAQVRQAILTAVAGCGDLALDATIAKPSWHQDSLRRAECLPCRIVAFRVDLLDVWLQRGRVHPSNRKAQASLQGSVLQRLDHAHICIGVAHVLADEGNSHLLSASIGPVGHYLPVAEASAACLGWHGTGCERQRWGNAAAGALRCEAQPRADDPADILLRQEQRHAVEVRDVVQRDDAVWRHLTEKRELVPHRCLHRPLRAAHQQVRAQARLTQ